MELKYELFRSARKTITIIIRQGHVIVRAPQKLSQAAIDQFVASKRKWIEDKLNKLSQTQKSFASLENFEEVFLFGEPHIIRYSHTKRTKLIGDTLFIADGDPRQRVSAFVKKLAKDHLEQRLNHLAKAIGVKVSGFALTNAKKKWGSCASNNSIRLNWRLVMLPPTLVDYVIIHELCHTIHHNHSASFWKTVAQHCPDYQKRRQSLKDFAIINLLY